MAYANITVFGGSGFVGRHLVQRLAEGGARVRVAVRDPEAAAFLKPMGSVGQVVPMQANIRNEASVRRAVEGADAVINAVGILYERGRQRYDAIHLRGAALVATAAREAGAKRLLHLSAIGAGAEATSRYGRSKAAGERAVAEAFPGATVVRPSIVFGPEDQFFNRFAGLSLLTPALPLIGGGETRLQPVYVGDVAQAMVRMLDDGTTAGRTYELGGPRVYSFKQLMELMLREIGRRRLLLPVPFGLMRFEAMFLQLLPVPPLTVDQVDMLKADNVVGEGALGFADLAMVPTAAEAVLPSYLARYRRGGKKLTAAPLA